MDVQDIVERVLLQLAPRDILRASQVCKTWKLTVDSSPSLQRALFFTADFAQPNLKLNPLIRAVFPVFNRGCHLSGPMGDIEDRRKGWNVFPFPWQGRRMMQRKLEKRESIFYPEASWRRMLIFQPPVVEVDLIRWFDSNDRVGERGQRCFQDVDARMTGLRMGPTYDLILSQYRAKGYPYQFTVFTHHRAHSAHGTERLWIPNITRTKRNVQYETIYKPKEWATSLRLVVRVASLERGDARHSRALYQHILMRSSNDCIAEAPDIQMHQVKHFLDINDALSFRRWG